MKQITAEYILNEINNSTEVFFFGEKEPHLKLSVINKVIDILNIKKHITSEEINQISKSSARELEGIKFIKEDDVEFRLLESTIDLFNVINSI